MATSSREERRRRIVERGSDRMDLITGRIQSLPSSSASSSSTQHFHHSSADFDQQISFSDQTYAGADDDIGEKTSMENTFDAEGRVEPQLQTSKKGIEPAEAEKKAESSLVASVVREAPKDPEPPPEPPRAQPYYFSSKQINSCIMASEGTRFFCSVIIALLVVQSYTSSPLLNRKSIIAWRPLYILLLTNATIVLGLLLLEKRRGALMVEEEDSMASQEEGHAWTGAVKVLERGLVVYQTIRAVFIDSSVYMVIVICGISLIRG